MSAVCERIYAVGVNRTISGEIVHQRQLPDFRVFESLYPEGLRLDAHFHEHAYFSLILEGTYTETYRGSSAVCGAGSVRFLPAGEMHSNSYDSNVRCLLVEILPSALDRLSGYAAVIKSPGEVSTAKAALLSRRLCSEFREKDDLALLAMEGVLLEMLAEGVRSAGVAPKRAAPRWLQRARDLLDTRFLDVPSLGEIAAVASVHPVHLSREFRKHYDCTIGEYLRKLRVEHASRLLVNTDIPLSEIALTCGFADQSHFSATFKRTTGITPARFREMHSRL
jgi:AraC family transcriptional regulator